MNIKIHTVISDLLGKTGMSMVKAILAGQRDPEQLVNLCDPRIEASREDITKSLEGVWKEEYIFMLRQAVSHYEFHQGQIKECELLIEELLRKQVAKVNEGDITGLEHPKKKSKKPRKNEYDYELLPLLNQIVKTDISKVPGIGESSALELMSEIGTDMSKWMAKE